MKRSDIIEGSHNTAEENRIIKSNRNLFTGILICVVLLLGVISTGMLLQNQQEFREYAAGPATDASLPVPANINIIPEDTSVLMNWNNQSENSFWFNPQSRVDQGTNGYVV